MIPSLSILLPTSGYKDALHAFLIPLCSPSLIRKSFEVLISDNSNAPLLNARDIDFYSSRLPFFSYVHNIPSCTAVRNWNVLLGLARGEFVWVCHHDEYLAQAPVRFEELFDIINSSQSLAFVLPLYKSYCVSRFGRKISFLQKHSLSTPLLKYFIERPIFLFSINIIGPPSCIIYRRDLFLRYDENLSWLVDIYFYYSLFSLISISEVTFLSHRKFKIISDQTFVDTLTASLSGSLLELRKAEMSYLSACNQLLFPDFLPLVSPILRLLFLVYRFCFTRF